MDLQQLADDLIATHERGHTGFGVYVLRSDEPAAELARHVEREVFLEFFGNTPELLAAEYGPYESASVFICVIDHVLRQPAGVMRIIVPSACGAKSLHDLEARWGQPGRRRHGPVRHRARPRGPLGRGDAGRARRGTAAPPRAGW